MNNFKNYIGKKVRVTIDRKLGSKHPKWGFIYLNNYGYIPNTDMLSPGETAKMKLLLSGNCMGLNMVSGSCIPHTEQRPAPPRPDVWRRFLMLPVISKSHAPKRVKHTISTIPIPSSWDLKKSRCWGLVAAQSIFVPVPPRAAWVRALTFWLLMKPRNIPMIKKAH